MIATGFVNQAQIAALKDKIKDTLSPLVEGDYVLLDVPNHRNIGDNMIWKGELEFLSGLPYKHLYTANMHTCRFNRIPTAAVILIHGGGNFGDIYPESQQFKLSLIERFPDNKIIIFPQTAYYKEPRRLKREARVINAHKDLHLCLRDHVSYEMISRYVDKEKLLLLPDMAFCLDLSAHHTVAATGRVLILKRTDHELSDDFNLADLMTDCGEKAVEIRDWPSYGNTQAHTRWITRFDSIERRLSEVMVRLPGLQALVDPAFGLRSPKNMDKYVQQGIGFINRYDKVVTTRLHGFILAALLNKKVRILDNSYGKNINFYNTWLSTFRHVEI
ncbi:polysaccharide pyruvyl transferase family protein [Chitinophaga japonensis]|uniref:Pyruvyl transferase EpsO n=1 Tax=Chitinophaga japonensis TaxID=104662 RepID=A0A562T4K9_CHIJA|nr:polysaccharide pyruvyl transferase family protein [Chitinophaga japonensis]TWI88218.1 pyruvyl transferase EpsO [Chitinophaga japonensis]